VTGGALRVNDDDDGAAAAAAAAAVVVVVAAVGTYVDDAKSERGRGVGTPLTALGKR
jgi:hypothetical protein